MNFEQMNLCTSPGRWQCLGCALGEHSSAQFILDSIACTPALQGSSGLSCVASTREMEGALVRSLMVHMQKQKYSKASQYFSFYSLGGRCCIWCWVHKFATALPGKQGFEIFTVNLARSRWQCFSKHPGGVAAAACDLWLCWVTGLL